MSLANSLRNRVSVTSTSTGTGDIVLGPPRDAGWLAPDAALDGEVVGYLVEHTESVEREWGKVTYDHSPTPTLLRATTAIVRGSTNGGAKEVFTSGVKIVSFVPLAEDDTYLIGDGQTIREGTNFAAGTSKIVADAVWGTPSGMNVTITSVASNLPVLIPGQYWEVDHGTAANDGHYLVTTSSATTLLVTKLTGSAPVAAASSSVTINYYYPIKPDQPRDRSLKVLGAGSGGTDPLTADMQVRIDPRTAEWLDRAGNSAVGYVEKVDSSAFGVIVGGAGSAGTGQRTLGTEGDYLRWRREQISGASYKFEFEGLNADELRAKFLASGLIQSDEIDNIAYTKIAPGAPDTLLGRDEEGNIAELDAAGYANPPVSGISAVDFANAPLVGDGATLGATHYEFAAGATDLDVRLAKAQHATDQTLPVEITVANAIPANVRILLVQPSGQTGICLLRAQTSASTLNGKAFFTSAPTNAALTGAAGTQVTIGGTALTAAALAYGSMFRLRDHSTAGNNGYYRAIGTPTTTSITAVKLSGSNPVNAAAEAVSIDVGYVPLTGPGSFVVIVVESATGSAATVLVKGDTDEPRTIEGVTTFTDPIPSPAFSGVVSFARAGINSPLRIVEPLIALGNVSGTVAVDLTDSINDSTVLTATLTAAATLAPVMLTGQSVRLLWSLAGFTLTFPTGSRFHGGTVPTLGTGLVDLHIYKRDATPIYDVRLIASNVA